MKRAQAKLILLGVILLAGVGVITLIPVAGTKADPAATLEEVPAYLDILSASINEVARNYDFHATDDVPSRQVLLSLTVSGTPTCGPASPFLVYGFLIDADKNGSTGTTDTAFGDLGIEARICATCNPATSAFESPFGQVTVTTDPGTGETTFKILITANQLPSIDFNWIAFSQEGTAFYRLPDLPDHQSWTTRERSLN